LPSLSHVVPNPNETWKAISYDVSSGALAEHGLVTLKEVMYGFGVAFVASAVLALMLDHWELLNRMFYPVIIFFQALPKVAIAPLLVTWFGFGITSKAATAS